MTIRANPNTTLSCQKEIKESFDGGEQEWGLVPAGGVELVLHAARVLPIDRALEQALECPVTVELRIRVEGHGLGAVVTLEAAGAAPEVGVLENLAVVRAAHDVEVRLADVRAAEGLGQWCEKFRD